MDWNWNCDFSFKIFFGVARGWGDGGGLLLTKCSINMIFLSVIFQMYAQYDQNPKL